MARTLPSPVPWVVVDAVALRLDKLQPSTVRLVGDLGNRMRTAALEAATDDAPVSIVEVEETSVDALVWAGDGEASSPSARAEILELALRCHGDIVLCEPVAAGIGIGVKVLKEIDPAISRFECDEVPDGAGGSRERSSWEAPAVWVVAQAAAWRFREDAEVARSGFRSRLPRMSPAEMVLACRRLIQRFECAYELFALAVEELGRRQDESGARQVIGELELHSKAPAAIRRRARRVLNSFGGEEQPQRRSA